MPTVTRKGGTTGTAYRKPTVAVKPKVAVAKVGAKTNAIRGARTLNHALSEPIKNLEQINWLLYGEPGIGKSSLAGMFEKAYFLFFEPGAKGLRLNKSECYTWKELVEDIGLLCADNRYHTIVFDNADRAYKLCFQHVCRREGMSHPNDKGWGEGWNLIRVEFEAQLMRLASAGKAFVFVAHANDKEMQTRSGRSYQKIIPRMGSQAFEFIGAFVDMIGFYGYYGEERFLTIRGNDEIEAKCRMKENFRTTVGRPVHSIPMSNEENEDFDETNAFENLRAAFYNEQEDTGRPEDSVTLSNVAAKPKTKPRRV